VTQLAEPVSSTQQRLSLVDCDVHNAVPNDAALHPYLSARWKRHNELFGSHTTRPFRKGFRYPKITPGGGARVDAWPASGALPGSDLDLMREQLLDLYNVDVAVLNTLHQGVEQRNEDYAAALSRAVNEWQVEHWLEKDSRLRASVTVPYESPELAAAEIRRVAAHPGFVQVLLLPRTREPLGRRRYWPIYEAAAEVGLPIGIHFASSTIGPVTAGGWPSYYIEDHTVASIAFQTQLPSLILEGVFDRFPTLQAVLVEGGFAWLPPLMDRMDALYHRMRDEVPDLQRLPSEYVPAHIRLTTQPMEEPTRPRDLLDLIEDIGNELLMFSTDYPHWDFDNPHRAFQTRLTDCDRSRIMHENATAFYNLGAQV
jgi:hypothetical protein